MGHSNLALALRYLREVVEGRPGDVSGDVSYGDLDPALTDVEKHAKELEEERDRLESLILETNETDD